MVSREDFQRWKSDPITQEFKQSMLQAADGYIASLVSQAGLDPLADRKTVGTVEGLTWLVEWEPAFIDLTEDIDGDEDSRT